MGGIVRVPWGLARGRNGTQRKGTTDNTRASEVNYRDQDFCHQPHLATHRLSNNQVQRFNDRPYARFNAMRICRLVNIVVIYFMLTFYSCRFECVIFILPYTCNTANGSVTTSEQYEKPELAKGRARRKRLKEYFSG